MRVPTGAPVPTGRAVSDQASRPLYRQVADELRRQIQYRELEPGSQLPTEAGLMRRHGVSRNTVRLALGVLRTEGLVVTGQGRGSFVAEPSEPDAPDAEPVVELLAGRPRASDDVLDLGEPGRFDAVEVTVTQGPAPSAIADRLGVGGADEVVARHRVLTDGDVASHLIDSYVAAHVATDALRRPAPLPGGVLTEMARAGRPAVRHADEVTVRMPTPTEARTLRMATGVPLLSVVRTSSDAEGVPLCATVALLPGDRHAVRYEVDAAGDRRRAADPGHADADRDDGDGTVPTTSTGGGGAR